MSLKNSYKQANNFLHIKILCLVENETKVLKTGGKSLVKNTQTSVSVLISYYLSSLQLVVLVKQLHVNSSRKTRTQKTTASRRVCLPILARNPCVLK